MSESTKKTPVLRLATLNSDETAVVHATRTVSLLHPDQVRTLEGVTATVRLLAKAELKALEEKHRLPAKTGKGLEWKPDTEKLVAEILVLTVEAWTGVIGADNRPMPLCPAALLALDDLNKAHLASIAKTPAEVVDAEQVEASFRESA